MLKPNHDRVHVPRKTQKSEIDVLACTNSGALYVNTTSNTTTISTTMAAKTSEVQASETTASTTTTPTKQAMSWTPEKDLILCREIIFQNPYNEKKKSIQRSAIWDSIADKLNDIDTPRFNMDKRSVRDHIGILIKRQKRKLAAEEKASGINPEPTELDDALEEIITLDEASEMELLELNYEKKEKVEQDKLKATDIRQKAMEKLREMQLRQRDGGEKKKRKRRNGDDTLKFLKEKSDKDIELRKEEFKLKQSQQSMEEKRVDALLALQKQQQDNQMAQQEQQKQMMNMQMLMFNQQQEQTKALMSLMDKFVTSKQ